MNPFKDWMDADGITPEQAADIFGKSIGTIRNWRSSGVPGSQREWVERRIQEWTGKPVPETPSRVVLEVSRDSFRRWNRVSMQAGMMIEDWAIVTLDEAGAEQGVAEYPTGSDDECAPVDSSLALTAEERGNYLVGDATLGSPSPAPRTRDSA